MPRVSLDNIHDPRVRLLAHELGIDEYSALGRLAHVYEYQTERCVYNVPIKMLSILGGHPDFADCLLKADLAEVAADDPGALRIRGGEGRIEWLTKNRENGKKGGRPRTEPTQTECEPSLNPHETERKPSGNPELTQCEPTANPLTLALTQEIKGEIKSSGASPGFSHPPPGDFSSEFDADPRDPPDLAAIWNANCGKLARADGLDDFQLRLWHGRWARHPDKKIWIRAIRRLAASSLARGETTFRDGSVWKATLGFLLKPASLGKIEKGLYDDPVEPASGGLAVMDAARTAEYRKKNEVPAHQRMDAAARVALVAKVVRSIPESEVT